MQKQTGFTLVELIVTLVVAAVLASLAAPNLRTFIKNNARATNVNSMVTAVNYARSQAVSRNTLVSICPSATPFAACSAGNSYAAGFLVFVDDDGNPGAVAAGDGNGALDAGETVLRVFQPDMGASDTFTGKTKGGTAVNSITYRGDGMPRNWPGFMAFNYCDDRGASEALAVQIEITGRPLTTPVWTDDGSALTCP